MYKKKSSIAAKLTAVILVALMLVSILPVSGLSKNLTATAASSENVENSDATPDEVTSEEVTPSEAGESTNSGSVTEATVGDFSISSSSESATEMSNGEYAYTALKTITLKNSSDITSAVLYLDDSKMTKKDVEDTNSTENYYVAEYTTDGTTFKVFFNSLNEGSHKLVLKTPNDSGEETELVSYPFIIDNNAPKIEIVSYSNEVEKDTDDDHDGKKDKVQQWTNQDVTVKFEVSENGSGIKNIVIKGSIDKTENITANKLDDNGTYSFTATDVHQKYEITVVDKANKQNSVTTEFIKIDKNAPSKFSIKFEKNVAENVLNFLTFGMFANSEIKATVTVTNIGVESNVKEIILYNVTDNGTEDGTEELKGEPDITYNSDIKSNNKFTKTFKLPVKDEKYDLKISASDEAGNKTEKISITSENVDIYADGEIATVVPGFYETIVTKLAPSVKVDGKDGIDVKFNKNPLTNANDEMVYSGQGTFKATVVDELSGLKNVKVYFGKTCNEELVQNDEDISKAKDKKVTEWPIEFKTGEIESGYYTFKISATNNSGNTVEESVNVAVDNNAPEITGVVYDNNWTKEDREVLIETTDHPNDTPCGGIKNVEVVGCTKNSEPYDVEENEDGLAYVFKADYYQQYKIIVTDVFGYTCTKTTDFIKVDKSAPTIGDFEYDNDNNEKWVKDNVVVTFTVDDIFAELDQTLSDIKSVTVVGPNGEYTATPVENSSADVSTTDTATDTNKKVYKYSFTADTYGSYKVTVEDNAGNTAESSTEEIKIDKTAPVIESFKFKENDSLGEKVLSFLTFGVYSNNDIKVTVSAYDTIPSSGFDSFTLTSEDGCGCEIVEGSSTEDGNTIKKTFTLKNGVDVAEDSLYKLTATITDKAGLSDTDTVETLGGYYNENGAKVTVDKENFEVVSTDIKPEIINENGIDVKFDNGFENDVYSGQGTFKATLSDELSGFKDVKVYFGKTGNEELMQNDEDISKAEDKKVTEWPIEFKTGEIESGYYTFKISATNNSGNTLEESVDVVVDNSKPKIERVDLITEQNQNYYYNKSALYSNSAIDVKVTAKDDEPSAGITSIKLHHDTDTEINSITSTEINEDGTYTYTFHLGLENFDYILSAEAVDAFGHTTDKVEIQKVEVYVNGEEKNDINHDKFIVNVDTKSPEVTDFSFTEGRIDGEGIPVDVSNTDYGYYFKDSTTVTVKANDDFNDVEGSGVDYIHFQTIDIYGKTTDYDNVNVKNNEASFVVPANFKGQINAYVVDKVTNIGDKVSPEDVIVENQTQHDASSSISFSKPSTSNKDIDGRDLYSADYVPVTITVEDTYSGIAKIEYTVQSPQDQGNNITETLDVGKNYRGLDSVEGWKIESHDQNLATKMSRTINVRNNSNNIVVSAKITDRAGHVTEKEFTPFSIDKTAPVIDVKFDNNDFKDFSGERYFKANRTATITVTERNFDRNDFETIIKNTDGVIPALSNWSTSSNLSDPDKTTHTAQIVFSADGDYTLDMSFQDMADNKAKSPAQEKFTLDKTLPEISVSFDNNSSLNNNYYKAQRTATITVKEHNFAADTEHLDIKVTAFGADNNTSVAAPGNSGWSNNGDIHTTTITFADDGNYSFTVDYKDLAYNEAEQEKVDRFYVDKTKPEIKFENVQNNTAYANEIAPQVIFTDNNYNGYSTFVLQRIDINSKSQNAELNKNSVINGSVGEIITYDNFADEPDNDGIYKLSVKLTDKAGNENSSDIVFSVNRYGSTFQAGNDSTTELIESGYTNAESDIVIKEINVNKVSAQTISVALNNSDFSNLKVNEDYTVTSGGGSGSWHEYTYKINKDNFAKEGFYTLTLSTTDQVEHTVSNRTAKLDERKFPVSFTVDKTKPEIRISGIESDTPYEEASKDVKIVCEDTNISAEKLVIKLNGNTLNADDKNIEISTENAGEVTAILKVKAIGSNTKQNIEVSIADKAGNDNEDAVKDFILSASLLTRFLANRPLVIITVVGLALAITIVLIIVVKKRKKNEEA